MTSEPAEEWRLAPGCLTHEVSSLGRVRRASAGRGARIGRILNRKPRLDGCIVFTVGPRRTKTTYFVHVLVALAFVGPRPSPAHEVNHKDFDRSHNWSDNLEWLTHHENVLHAVRGGRHPGGHSHGRAKLNTEAVKVLRHFHRRVPTRLLGRLYGVSSPTVSIVGRGGRYP